VRSLMIIKVNKNSVHIKLFVGKFKFHLVTMLMTMQSWTVFLFRYLGVDDVTLYLQQFINESHKTES